MNAPNSYAIRKLHIENMSRNGFLQYRSEIYGEKRGVGGRSKADSAVNGKRR